jgi:aminomethyltransferase
MVEFGGWHMPVFYTGITEEHRAVRARAGLFDVSHMGQLELSGDGAEAYLQTQLSNDLGRLTEDGQAQYTLLTNERGGIVDDLIVYRMSPLRWLLVVNAANIDADRRHLARDLPADVGARRPLAGVGHARPAGGPAAFEVSGRRLGPGEPGARRLSRSTCVEATSAACAHWWPSRYTGEPGVELLCHVDETEKRVRRPAPATPARRRAVRPGGPGDTLRLEVCYPLHGSDIGRARTPSRRPRLGLRARHRRRRSCAAPTSSDAPATPGRRRRLVAFRMLERAIPRAGLALFSGAREVGTVTSGTLSPSLDEGIGLAYVEADAAQVGSALVLDVRGRRRDAEIAAKPLYTPQAKKES